MDTEQMKAADDHVYGEPPTHPPTRECRNKRCSLLRNQSFQRFSGVRQNIALCALSAARKILHLKFLPSL